MQAAARHLEGRHDFSAFGRVRGHGIRTLHQVRVRRQGRLVTVDVAGDAFGIAAEQVDGRQELLRSTLSQPPPGPFLFLTPDRLTVLDVVQLGTPSERRG